jgi:hypothetical protein
MSVYLGVVSMADEIAAGVGALVALLDFARRRRDKTHPLRPRRAPIWLTKPSDARNFVKYGHGPWPRRRRMVGGLIIVPLAVACVIVSGHYAGSPAPIDQTVLGAGVLLGVGYVAVRVFGAVLKILTWPFRGQAG